MTSTNLLRLLAATAATFSIGAAHPQFNNWTGASGSNWSTAANWTAGVPVAGASLEFPAAANKTGVNDLVGLSLFRIDFTASGHVLSGNGVAITDGLRCANNVDSTAGFLVDMGAANTVVTNRDGIALSCTVRATGGLAGSGTITVGAYTIFAVGGPSTFSGQIHLDECRNLGCGRLRLEGVSMPSANVFSSTPAQAGITAEISGNGTIGDATRVTMSPGTSTTFGVGNGVGVIATKNLDVSARLFNIDLAGPAPGSGYDQVAVTGTVTLGGASLKLRMAPGFAPPVGHVFTIVGNDGADAVIGAFAGLAEGAIITDKGFDLRLSYAGGDGNDVTLTVMVAPKVWTGAAGTLWSNPGNWAGGVVPQNGDRLRFPPGAANLTNTNDISGLVLHSVGFDGADYSLGGSGVVVTSLVESTILPDPMLGVTQFNTVAMPIDVQANAVAVRTESQLSYVRISGAISGTGPITIQSYTLSLQGSGGYSGTITLGCRTIDSLNPFLACGRLNLEGASYPFANVDSPGGFNSAGGFNVVGNGTIGSLTRVGITPAASGIPMMLVSAGVLSTGSMAGGTGTGLAVSMSGTAPGTGYDQLRVTGTVNVTNMSLFLDLGMPVQYAPPPGQVFTIIDNDGTDPVVGRFLGMPNGATVQPIGGTQFRLSYIGGDGNDVTLTAMSGTPRLVNISTRTQILTGDDVLIGGFIIGGNSPKNVVVRARGPSLAAQGIVGALQDPILQIFSGQTPIMANDDWQAAANAATIQASDLAPPDPRESAILMTLNPGAYTAIVAGVQGSTGVGMIEVFEADQPEVSLVNIATRGKVGSGDNVLIAGFIIQGSGPQQVVVRARGPSLAAQGVPGVLANPQLQLFAGPTPIASNDNWQQATNAADIQSSGFAPSDPNESAILVTLNPGAYTAIVSGVAGTTGVAIVEVFKN